MELMREFRMVCGGEWAICCAECSKHAADSAEEASAQAAGRLGFPGPSGSVSGRLQRAVHGVDLATDAGPVSVLPDPAGPTRAGQHAKEGYCSAYSREERAAAGASQARRGLGAREKWKREESGVSFWDNQTLLSASWGRWRDKRLGGKDTEYE